MDQLALAAAHRARSALDFAIDGHSARQKSAAFVELARTMMTAPTPETIGALLGKSQNELVRKASAVGLDEWGADAQALAAAFVASIAPGSLLDQIARYATPLPPQQLATLIASGSIASTVGEAAPKIVRLPGLDAVDAEPTKCAGLVVMSLELARFAAVFQRILQNELGKSVNRACNAAVLDLVTDSSTTTITGTGDPLADLRAGLAAAGPSDGYVVAAPQGDVQALATSEANRGGMGVRGGSFAPGVEIVAMETAGLTVVIPASRLAVRDFGLRIARSDHATIDMADSPTSPATTPVSMFQTNSRGIIAERAFNLGGDFSGVVIVAGA